MSLNINQVLPNNTSTIQNLIKNTNVSLSSSTDTVICSPKTYDNMLSSFNMSSLDLDLPNTKILNGVNGDFLPDFTKFKIKGLKLKGLDLPFKCSIKSMSDPLGKSTLNKSSINKLGNILCNDINGGLDTDLFKNAYLTAAYGLDLCAKKPDKSIDILSGDLSVLAKIGDKDSLNISKSITKAVVDNKFDVGSASVKLASPLDTSNIRESIQVSKTPIDKIFKVGKVTKIKKDKDPVISYATSITNSHMIFNNINSPIIQLAKDATMDSQAKSTDVHSGTLYAGQKLMILSKAFSNSKIGFISKIKKYA